MTVCKHSQQQHPPSAVQMTKKHCPEAQELTWDCRSLFLVMLISESPEGCRGWAEPPPSSPLPQPLKCLQVLVGAQSCPAHLPPQVTTASTTTTNWGTGIEITLLITGNVCKAISWHGVYCSQSPASTTLSTHGTRDVARLACSRHLKHSPSALSLASQLGAHGLLSCPHSCPLFFLLHTPLKEMAT